MPGVTAGTVWVGSGRLSLEEVAAVAGGGAEVKLAKEAVQRMARGHAALLRLLDAGGEAHYGINTGFGSLKDVRIPAGKLRALQLNLIRSHAVGVGPRLPPPAVRAMMLLRAHALAQGYSGVRPEVAEQIVSMLNADLTPVVPAQGSVGASGDLAPLAHLALAMIGEGAVLYRGKRTAAGAALRAARISPLRPEPKEALALLNGTQMMTALGVLALVRAANCLRHADLACAMTLEATLGSPRAFDERVQRLRPHPGQADSAHNLRKLTAESEIYESHRKCERVQDAYSVRCAPQVHGAARDTLAHVRAVLERETASVTDNPILFFDRDEAVSAGNFHGQPVATALDSMALALATVASISERRTARLLNPQLSELPAGLVEEAGINSGLMMLQVTAAALTSECKTLAHPASVDSIPTWADQEDHVSMGALAARKAGDAVEALEKVLAIEILCAAQGLEFRKPLRPARGVRLALAELRRSVAPLKGDKFLGEDLDRAVAMLREGALLWPVRKALGELK